MSRPPPPCWAIIIVGAGLAGAQQLIGGIVAVRAVRAVWGLGASRHVLDRAPLQALAPDLDVAAVATALDAVRGACRALTSTDGPQDSTLGARFGWLAAPRSTVVQPGPVHGGLTHDPRRELERLLVQMTG